MNNYNGIAPIYDPLAKIVFLGALDRAKKAFIEKINSGDHVLILGGGTGKELEWLPKGVTVDFVEPAKAMIERARRRKHNVEVRFINRSFEEYDEVSEYDFVICNFFLDLFDQVNLKRVTKELRTVLNEQGRLIVTDFQIKPSHVWHQLMSHLMHVFFLFATQLQSRSLKVIDDYLNTEGFKVNEEKLFFGEFVYARLYNS